MYIFGTKIKMKGTQELLIICIDSIALIQTYLSPELQILEQLGTKKLLTMECMYNTLGLPSSQVPIGVVVTDLVCTLTVF